MEQHLIYATILLGLAGLFVALWLREHRAHTRAELEKEKIEVEEHRMFEFLHGLGGSLQEDSSPPNMHRIIVEGVTQVVEAKAGILYLVDESRDTLVPVFHTEETAPIIALPLELNEITDATVKRARLRSFLKLSAVPSSTGILGEALESENTVHAPSLLDHPSFEGSRNEVQEGMAALVAPLVYANKRVGVLAVIQQDKTGFSKNDCDVFQTIAEQSSFALGSAIIHADAHDKRRLEAELKQASDIQRILLPKKSPDLSDYHLAATYVPARIVSGDYYDYIKVDEDRYGVVIGDVCGKGIAASLIMAMCRSIIRSYAPDNLSPSSVLHSVNRSIFPDIKEDMFVSFLYLILERDSDEITLARAGHETPLLWRAPDKVIETINPPGMAAGVDPGNVFKRAVKDYRIQMKMGDVFLLYTDGVIELMNPEGEEFGIDRLEETFAAVAHDATAEEVVQSISATLTSFANGTNLNDDITLIAIDKR